MIVTLRDPYRDYKKQRPTSTWAFKFKHMCMFLSFSWWTPVTVISQISVCQLWHTSHLGAMLVLGFQGRGLARPHDTRSASITGTSWQLSIWMEDSPRTFEGNQLADYMVPLTQAKASTASHSPESEPPPAAETWIAGIQSTAEAATRMASQQFLHSITITVSYWAKCPSNVYLLHAI